MIALKWLLVVLGIGLFGSAGALVAYDIYLASQLRQLLKRQGEAEGGVGAAALLPSRPFGPVRWQLALQLAGLAVVPLLVAQSVLVVPDGHAGVRVSQIWACAPVRCIPACTWLRRSWTTWRSMTRGSRCTSRQLRIFPSRTKKC